MLLLIFHVQKRQNFLECVHLQGNNFPVAAFLLLILSSNQFHIILLMSSHRMSSSISMLSSHEITIDYWIGNIMKFSIMLPSARDSFQIFYISSDSNYLIFLSEFYIKMINNTFQSYLDTNDKKIAYSSYSSSFD